MPWKNQFQGQTLTLLTLTSTWKTAFLALRAYQREVFDKENVIGPVSTHQLDEMDRLWTAERAEREALDAFLTTVWDPAGDAICHASPTNAFAGGLEGLR
jgi:hypothetical protein